MQQKKIVAGIVATAVAGAVGGRLYWQEQRKEILQKHKAAGELLSRDGQHQQAVAEYSRAVDELDKLDLKDEEAEGLLDRLAQSYELSGNIDEAQSTYLRLIQMRVTRVGRTHISVGQTLVRLGDLYRKTNRYQTAGSSYVSAAEVFAMNSDHAAHAESLLRIVELALRQSMKKEVTEYYEQALDALRPTKATKQSEKLLNAIDDCTALLRQEGMELQAEALENLRSP